MEMGGQIHALTALSSGEEPHSRPDLVDKGKFLPLPVVQPILTELFHLITFKSVLSAITARIAQSA
jgi:hypothetical protein